MNDKHFSQASQTSAPLPEEFLNRQGQRFKLIPAGEFMMGDTLTQEEADKKYPGKDEFWFEDAHPRHKVIISQPFYMGIYEVTVGEFRKFVEATGYQTTAEKEGTAFGNKGDGWEEIEGLNWRNSGFEQESNHPVTCVSWDDTQAYIKWLNKRKESVRPKGFKYALPTEAQWEYACRAGSTTDFFWGDDASQGEGYLNGAGEDGAPWGTSRDDHFPFKTGYQATSPVGHYKPNAWGLYDMLGNVWEWCEDLDGEYLDETDTDPTGATAGPAYTNRGGSWNDSPSDCRCAFRGHNFPESRSGNLGFRLALRSLE